MIAPAAAFLGANQLHWHGCRPVNQDPCGSGWRLCPSPPCVAAVKAHGVETLPTSRVLATAKIMRAVQDEPAEDAPGACGEVLWSSEAGVIQGQSHPAPAAICADDLHLVLDCDSSVDVVLHRALLPFAFHSPFRACGAKRGAAHIDDGRAAVQNKHPPGHERGIVFREEDTNARHLRRCGCTP